MRSHVDARLYLFVGKRGRRRGVSNAERVVELVRGHIQGEDGHYFVRSRTAVSLEPDCAACLRHTPGRTQRLHYQVDVYDQVDEQCQLGTGSKSEEPELLPAPLHQIKADVVDAEHPSSVLHHLDRVVAYGDWKLSKTLARSLFPSPFLTMLSPSPVNASRQTGHHVVICTHTDQQVRSLAADMLQRCDVVLSAVGDDAKGPLLEPRHEEHHVGAVVGWYILGPVGPRRHLPQEACCVELAHRERSLLEVLSLVPLLLKVGQAENLSEVRDEHTGHNEEVRGHEEHSGPGPEGVRGPRRCILGVRRIQVAPAQ